MGKFDLAAGARHDLVQKGTLDYGPQMISEVVIDASFRLRVLGWRLRVTAESTDSIQVR